MRSPIPLPSALFTALACTLAGALATDTLAADNTPFDLGRAQDISARPMALGGAYSAVATDASALYYNPAGLSSVRKHEWSLSMDESFLEANDRAAGFPGHKQSAEDLNIQSLAYVMPIPTVRGGLTFAFGFYRPRTFAELIGYEDALSASRGDYQYTADGSLNEYRAGFGLDIAPDLTFGLAFGYGGGTENIDVLDSGEVGYVRDYNGFDLEPSLMFKLSPRLRMGLSVVLWDKYFDLKETYEEKGVGSDQTDYQVSYPFQIKSGIAYQGRDFLISADAKYNGYSQYKYGSENAAVLQKAGYNDEWILSVGAEEYLPPIHGVLREGYTFNTLPETSFNTSYDLNRFSVGMGFVFSGALSIDAAYSYSFWGLTGDGLVLDNREHRGLLTLAYHY